ncbi:MAG: PQQ-dependent dehydrogenase, methanol/ethanol family [Phenylobacterium sp.]|uniref:PQQ-dependent dehydrogenase, methanol/ethanol family n=1 Tax=Phenylobacterium sp. TaxID=1871053 RepID=UPI001A629640|nr:PQQ-dependent dehydrogenase, methanol/ethanol family [Phenylobacterium sp.]MBL8552908.1 PQQ-dependent dehydrogenase, methanol/ethanol family [Phenylobacterium sp.]
MKLIRLGLALALAATVAACNKPPGNVDDKRLTAAAGNGEWLSYGKDYNEQRFSPLDKVNAGNVKDLGLAWFAEFDTDRGQEATPLMVDGVLYTSTAWSKVFAFDAKTGKQLWKFDPKVEGAKGFDACCDVVNRGVAIWKGKVYVGTIDGRLIALDAKTGAVAWEQQTTDKSRPYTITGAPRVVKDKVLIGNGGAEYGVRGYVSAYDAATGKLAWRFYTVPNPTGAPDGAASDKVFREKAAATWSDGEWKETGGGGTVWDSIVYDPALNMVYIGVGNGNPWNHQRRSGGKGDNLFLSSIVALNADTGEYVWHYQTTPGESWDYTATQQIMLADLNIAGAPRKVLMQAPKNGFFYVIDRANGQLISARPYANITWATGVDMKTGRPIENPAARYEKAMVMQVPGPLGAHNWQPMAYNARTGLVYIPTNVTPFAYTDDKAFSYRSGAWNVGVDFLANALPTDEATLKATMALVKGSLVAWDPVQQKAVWTVDHPFFWNAGVLSTAGGLVFQGNAEGELAAYDAAKGGKLWGFKTGNGIIAAPMTYELGGEQYVAVMVGTGGGGQISAPASMPVRSRLPGRLLVFRLGGKATAPAFPAPAQPPFQLAGVTSKGDVKHGFALFHQNCQVCHGPNASGAWLPDLKRSPMLQTEANWKGVVIDGASAARGMASFSRFLSPQDAEDIRAYVITEAQAAAKLAESGAKAAPATPIGRD